MNQCTVLMFLYLKIKAVDSLDRIYEQTTTETMAWNNLFKLFFFVQQKTIIAKGVWKMGPGVYNAGLLFNRSCVGLEYNKF